MNFEEHAAKSLILIPTGIPVPRGILCASAADAATAAAEIGPCVVKAQVPTGKRGKAGGIKLANTPAETEQAARQILGMRIGEYTVERVLIEEQGRIAREFYAAVLHDTLEDTETTAAELEALFGREVTSIVLEVTDDKSLGKNVRKQRQIEHAPHSSPKARLVKLADKICNLRDIIASPPAEWSAERKQAYFDWAAQVVTGLRGTHPGLEAVFNGLLVHRAELR